MMMTEGRMRREQFKDRKILTRRTERRGKGGKKRLIYIGRRSYFIMSPRSFFIRTPKDFTLPNTFYPISLLTIYLIILRERRGELPGPSLHIRNASLSEGESSERIW